MFNKILVLSPHTDDGEIGCGGSISRFIEEEKTVYYAAFSTTRTSFGDEFPDNILEKKSKRATKVMSIFRSNLNVLEY